MSTETMASQIKADLLIELSGEVNLNEALLLSKINGVIRELKANRRYAKVGYTQSMIEDDIEQFYEIIKNIALIRYTKVGAEGQSNYSADGENIIYEDERTYWSGVYPLASF